MSSLGDFGPVLEDVEVNSDGSLKTSGKQMIKFYFKKILSFKARWKTNAKTGERELDMDPKTGLPHKEAFEEEREFVRVETKGDTNIKDDFANDLDRQQHYRQYKFFRDGKIPDGNPIEEFDFLQPSTVFELHYYGIHVIQQVAKMGNVVCERLKDQSGFEIRDIAAQWVRIHSPEGQNMRLSDAEKRIKELEKMLAAKSQVAIADGTELPPPLARDGIEEVDLSQAVQGADVPKPRGRPRTRLV